MKNSWAICATCGIRFERKYALSASRADKPQFCGRECFAAARAVVPSPAPGGRYGRWSVLEAGPVEKGRKTWLCCCACGTERHVNDGHLKRGASTNCGCARKENNGRRSHGMSNSSEYRSWCLMKARCENEKLPEYKHYGGRGIKVCPSWQENFEQFLLDMGMKPSPGMSIDRIDVNGGYNPSNCRWATPQEQANNTRRNHLVMIKGEESTLAEAVRKYGGNYDSVKWRIRKLGMSAEDALGL